MTDNTSKTYTFTFDLSKVPLGEALDTLVYNAEEVDPKYVPNLMKTIKKALIEGDVPLTAEDIQPVIQAWFAVVLGGGQAEKN